MGDVDHTRFYHVGIVLVRPIGAQIFPYLGCGQFATVMRRKGKDLMTGSLHCPGLMMVDVSGDR